MAMIDLTVGVKPDVSYTEFKNEITKLVNQLDSKPIKIKVEVDTASLNSLKQQISAMCASMGKTGFGSAGASYAQVAKGTQLATNGTKELVKVTSEYKKDAESASRVISTYKDSINGTTTVIEEHAKKNGELATSITKVTESYKTAEQVSKEATKASQQQANVGKQIAQMTSDIASKQRALLKVGGGDTEFYGTLDGYKTELENLRSAYDNTGNYSEFNVELTKLKTKFISTKAAADEYLSTQRALSSSSKNASNVTNNQAQNIAKVKAALKEISITNSTISLSYKNLSKTLGGATATGQNATDLKAMKEKYLELQNAVETLRASKASATQEDINNIYRLQSGMQNLITSTQKRIQSAEAGADAAKRNTQETTAEEAVLKKYHTTLTQCESALNKFTAAKNSSKSSDAYKTIKEQAAELKSTFDSYNNGATSIDTLKQKIASVNTALASSTETIKANGDATRTLLERMGGLASKFSSWLTVSQAIMYAIRAVRNMVTASIELDTAMTELKKVTDESDATYNRFLEYASTRAAKLGASLSDIVTASADFARLGYDIGDASKLADVATVYKNVGDGIQDINEASESIIATMQAFGISASDAMSIVDKFNEVGNNYAISSEGVGEALLRSAAAMKAANNTLDETIALATAANTIVQDPEKVGTTLKTVSMYLRAAKTEAEEAGESTDGMASSVSELRDEILALTGGKVDIQIDDDTFKSTYQILKELSEVWDELTDVSQANILEMVGGKRNSNIVAALLENFSVAEAALETSANSAGSAMAENEKYLNSVQGKIDIMQASFQTLSKNLMSGDMLKFFVEAATKALNFFNGLTKIADILGTFPTLMAGLGGFLSLKNIGREKMYSLIIILNMPMTT